MYTQNLEITKNETWEQNYETEFIDPVQNTGILILNKLLILRNI